MPVQAPGSPQPTPVPYSGGAVALIIKTVSVELKDLGQSWLNSDYICDVLAIMNRSLATEFDDLDLDFDTQVEILPNVPAGTTDLDDYQSAGKPLYSLVLPLVIECRLAGQSQMQWVIVPRVDKVIDTDNNSGETGQAVSSSESYIASYEWRGARIILSPANQVMDVRVRFESLPLEIDADSPNQPAMGLVNTLAFMTALDIAASRGGAGASALVVKLTKQLATEKGNFEATQVKAKQSIQIRLGGRRSRGNGTVWNGNFQPPIL